MHSKLSAYQGIAPVLAAGVYVHDSATVIGDVRLGEDVSIWPGVVIRGDVNHILIGRGSNIQDLSVLHVNHKSAGDPQGSPLIVGDYVTVGHKVILHGCTIEDECLIGMGSIVMDKAVIEKQVLLAAGSLVPEGKVLQSGYLYMGSPARQVRALTADEVDHLRYSADNYIILKDAYSRTA